MTQDEIIEMAKRARLHRNQLNLASNPVQYRFSYDGTEEALIAFAKLVAEKEREACAKVTRQISDKYAYGYYGNEVDTADEIEAAIRARGQA